MKTLTTVRMTTQFLLVFAWNEMMRLSTTSVINGFSPSLLARRSSKNLSLSLIGQFWNRKSSICRLRGFSENQIEGPTDGIGRHEKKWLVVGDGDLSYSATIAENLVRKNIRLFATVLEEESVHKSVYKRSSQNKAAILSFSEQNHYATFSNLTDNSTNTSATTKLQSNHEVCFGIDATRLKNFFPSDKFQTIEFNFPHWGGKTNAKRNRQLVDSFLASACTVLHNDGEIIISLCEGQGGFPASNVDEWKQSWLVPEYAANHGLLLRKLSPYEPSYQQTSHRGKDRPWIKDGTAQRYTFNIPNQNCIENHLQMSCRHELRIVLPDGFNESDRISRDEIIDGDAVFHLTKKFVPEGIRMSVVAREIMESYFFNGKTATLAIFLLNYSGESMPLTRNAADGIRSQLEVAVCEQWGFNVAKSGRLVSRPYPTHLLPSLIKQSYKRKAITNANSA